MSTKTRFEEEAEGNSEMAYCKEKKLAQEKHWNTGFLKTMR